MKRILSIMAFALVLTLQTASVQAAGRESATARELNQKYEHYQNEVNAITAEETAAFELIDNDQKMDADTKEVTKKELRKKTNLQCSQLKEAYDATCRRAIELDGYFPYFN